MKKFNISLHGRKFYGKILTSLFLISFVSISVLGIVSTFYSKNLINKYHLQGAVDKINQISSAVNIIISQVESDGEFLSRSKMITDYYKYINGEYYENINHELDYTDLLGLYNYLQNKNKVFDLLINIASSNEYIYSIYMIDQRKNIVINNTFATYKILNFYDKEWLSILDGDVNEDSVINMGIRKINLPYYPTTEVLTLIYAGDAYMVNGELKTNAIIVNISTKVLFNDLLKDLSVNPHDLFWIDNAEGNTIMNQKTQLTNLIPIEMTNDNIKGYTCTTADGSDGYTVVNKQCDVFNWTIVVGIKNEPITDNISRLIKNMIIVVAGVILIDIIIIIFVGGRLYSPVQTLVGVVKKHSTDDITDDLSNITNRIINTYTQNEHLKLKLKESLPGYRSSYIRGLINNKSTDDENIQKMIENIGIGLSYENIYVAIISPKFNYKDRIKEGVYDYVNLKHTILEMVSLKFNSYILEDYNNRYILLFNANLSRQSEIFEVLNKINDFINNSLFKKCYTGISNYCENLSKLHVAYNEAVTALNYSILSKDEPLVFIADIIANNEAFKYPLEKEETLLLCIRNGREEEAEKLFDEIMLSLISSGQSSSHKLRIHMIRFLSRLLNTSENVKGEYYIPINESMKVLENHNKYEIIEWFRNVVISLTNNNIHTAEDLKEQHIDKIKDLINNNLGIEMTLTYVSDIMNLSPTYISRIFKQKTSSSFIEYLTYMRICYSKKLLADPNISIRDISELLGYSNSQYFIKIFKNHVGITPGKYRQAK